jgi:nickel-dependent lactate racemase
MEIQLPYSTSSLSLRLPDSIRIDHIEPPSISAAEDPVQLVQAALAQPLGHVDWSLLENASSVGIAVNDKTRPVPHGDLLPSLLAKLEDLGIQDDAITFYISVGTHPPMTLDEVSTILPGEILARYRVFSHDSYDEGLLTYLGETSKGTPVWTNKGYFQSDFKIAVGNIIPHQFMGFSGGVKTVAIGLSGVKTITANHTMMKHPDSQIGAYESNPARMDIEEIGGMVGVHLALNAIVNQDKKIVHALAGDPRAVMDAGIPLSRQVCQVEVPEKYDLMIASPGGHPKDLNVYQSQKGFFNAARVVRTGGTLILAAACPEGAGSPQYVNWMDGKESLEEILQQFEREGFQIGAHKAFLIARDAARVKLQFFSQVERGIMQKLLLNPVGDFQTAVDLALEEMQPGGLVGVLPHASTTMPFVATMD